MFALDNTVEKPVQRGKLGQISRAEWIQRKKDRKKALGAQVEGIESQRIFKLSVEAKLIQAGAKSLCASEGWHWFDNFLRCGVEHFYILCPICNSGHEAYYRCSQKWCPECNWRIAAKRRELLSKVTAGMSGVKHVVLTQKNFEHLTREKIMESRQNLLALRRQKIFGTVTGGCASLEFTNEEHGWHMHWHLLLQSQFIPADILALKWGELVGQEFAIVKVMDVTGKSYLQELCKYVVDGSEIARWQPWQILEFIIALRGTRSFTTFGKFKEIAKFARAVIACDRVGFTCADCGESDVVVGSDRQHALRIATKKGY